MLANQTMVEIVLYPNPANDVVRISGYDQMVYRE